MPRPSLLATALLASTACTTIHAVGGSARPDEFYVVTTKSFLVFTTAPVVLACTRNEATEPSCTRVLTPRQAGGYGLEPYEAWLDAGLELGEADAWNDVACQPEAACAQAAAEGPAALQGCLEGYRRSFDESTAGAPCPPAP